MRQPTSKASDHSMCGSLLLSTHQLSELACDSVYSNSDLHALSYVCTDWFWADPEVSAVCFFWFLQIRYFLSVGSDSVRHLRELLFLGIRKMSERGPLRSLLIHTFCNFTENLDQGGSGWIRRTSGTITPLGGPGLVFTFCWCTTRILKWECTLWIPQKSLHYNCYCFYDLFHNYVFN